MTVLFWLALVVSIVLSLLFLYMCGRVWQLRILYKEERTKPGALYDGRAHAIYEVLWQDVAFAALVGVFAFGAVGASVWCFFSKKF